MIETGRYSQIPRVSRLCPTCRSNQIEDEIHLLYHCPKYSNFRDRFYRKLEYHLPYIKRLSTLETTKELMDSDNYFVNIQLLRFILSCLNLRNNLSSIQTDVT